MSFVSNDGPKPRVFLSKAFLKEMEPNIYGLFRSLEMEETREGQEPVREKVRDVGPIVVLRECGGQEEPDLVSYHPVDQRPMRLRRVDNEGK